MDKQITIIITTLFLVLTLITFTTALTYTNPCIPSSAPNSVTGKAGFNLSYRSVGYKIDKVTKNSASTATKCYVQIGGWGGSVVDSGTFVGDDCELDYTMTANVTYTILADKEGASYTASYNNSCTFPVVDGLLNWTYGINQAGAVGGTPPTYTYSRNFDSIDIISAVGQLSMSSNITSPVNNTVISGYNFNTTINVTTEADTQYYNATLKIYNSAGTVVFTNHSFYNDVRGNFTDQINITLTSIGRYSYDVQLFYNDSNLNENRSFTTLKRFFTNGLQINVTDTDGNIIGDAYTVLDNSYTYNVNPLYHSAGLLGNLNSYNLTINASSIGGYYIPNNTIININLSNTEFYTVTLQPYKLFVKFTQEGSAFNVSGYITDENKSYTFQNVSYTTGQANLTNTLVYMRFIPGFYNISALTWDNKSQFYEYDNSQPHEINETIEIFKNVDTRSYFQTQDNGGNIIKNAKVRLYGVIPSNSSGQTQNYALYGQRITDNQGLTMFTMDSEAELYLTVSATGYQTKTVRLTASEIDTLTSDNPKIIRLEKASYVQQSGIVIGDLWKIDGTKTYPSLFNNLTTNYWFFIYDFYDRNIKYQTSYEGTNHTVTLDGTTKSGIIDLVSGTQFSSTDNSTWYIYVFVSDKLTYTITMNYNSNTADVIIDTSAEGLDTNEWWKVIAFFMLIFLSSIVALFFKTPDGDSGVHTFMIGGFIIGIAVPLMGWLAVIGTYFYLSKLIKQWISE